MPYTTEDSVRDASKLTDLEDVPVGALDGFIAKAQARIDAKLGLRYNVPFSDPVPPIIASIAQDLAAGFAIEKYYSDRPEKTEPYLAETLIKRAMHDLNEILDGTMFLEITSAQPTTGQAGTGNTMAQVRPAVMSTTPKRSEMEGVLERWLS